MEQTGEAREVVCGDVQSNRFDSHRSKIDPQIAARQEIGGEPIRRDVGRTAGRSRRSGRAGT
jgi:hypothetical protein